MTTTTTSAPIPTPAPSAIAAGVVPDRIVLAAALALLVGGPAPLALHVLWGIGHGPTVVNEHGVVLGLSNDEWSHWSRCSRFPVPFAVAVVAALHTGRTARAAGWLTGAGLAGGAAAAWIWPLYSLSALALGAGLACLAATLWRGPLLGRWLAVPPALAVAAWVPFVFWPDAMYAVEATVASYNVDLTDLTVVAQTVTWTALGVALLRRR